MPSREPAQSGAKPASFTRFGELLHFLRLRARITQRDLSIAVGYSFGQISRLEQGHRLPDPAVIAATFIPALDLQGEREWAERLIALAEEARRSQAAGSAATAEPQALAPVPPGASALLATKLFVPRPRPDGVPRPRLLAKLDGALGVPLTLLTAPAGWGKTTLLSAWLASLGGLHCAWLSLDANDNDPATFVRYLVAALQMRAPAVGATTLALLEAPHLPPVPALLTPLVNNLAALPDAIVLVLDDSHLLTSHAIHGLLQFLLDHLPPTLHLVLASREEPPLPLPRLRARGEVVELRVGELRFTPDEAYAFLRNTMHMDLSPEEAAVLEAQTEGWVTGLQLAALALQRQSDRADWIARTGSHHYVADYLTEEVFDRLPAHLRTFLLQTAILDRLCGPLCDALLGLASEDQRPQTIDDGSPAIIHRPSSDSYSQHIIVAIERMNLFLVPLDDQRGWYRYHHLFAEMLRARLLRGATSEAVAMLYVRASVWCAAQGLTEEAMRYALAADDPHLAARAIEQRAEALILGSEMTTLRRWIEQLPTAVLHQRRRLALAYAGVLLAMGDVAAVEPLLRSAERAQPPADGPLPGADNPAATRADRGWLDDIAGYTAAMRSIVARAQHDLDGAIARGDEALRLLPKGFVFMRSAAAWNVGMAHWMRGDLATADATFAAVVADNQGVSQVYAYLSATASLGLVRTARGQLHEAAQLYERALQHVGRLGVQLPSVGLIHVGLAAVLREWNDLDGALRHLAEGIAQGERFGSADVLVAAYTTLARVKQAQGDKAAAKEALGQGCELTPGFVHALDASQHARALLEQGDVAAAAAWATRNGVGVDTPAAYGHEAEQIILARVLLERGAYSEAAGLLERLAEAADAGGRIGSLIEVLALGAKAYAAGGDHCCACNALEWALSLAAPARYVRLFVDEGAPMAALLRALAAPDEVRPYVAMLLAAFPRG